MSASNGTNGYLIDWRNSFSLVRNNLYCPKGRTFRGAHPNVQTDGFAPNSCINQARADAGRSAGTAKLLAALLELKNYKLEPEPILEYKWKVALIEVLILM